MTKLKHDDRVLGIQMFFKLPDDFEGDLNEALEALVKHRKENAVKGKKPEVFEGGDYKWSEMFGMFVKELDEKDNHITGIVSVTKLDTEKQEWVQIKENPYETHAEV